MSERKWLRKWNPATGKWSNQCYSYSTELAKEPDMRLVDEAEKIACDARLAVEKAEMVKANLRRIAEKPVVVPKINKQDNPADPAAVTAPPPAPKEGMEVPKSEIDVEAIAKNPVPPTPEQIEAELNAVDKPDEPLNMPVDDLDDMSKVQLQNVIDAEELGVKKVGNKGDLTAAIRAARVAKKAAAPDAPAGMEAGKAQGDKAINAVKQG